jgi:drug/metabolite transporter (DMT)-like permease
MRIPKGSRYMLLSSLCFAVIGILVKLLSHISNLEINFFKSIFALIISFSILTYYKVPFWGSHPRHLLLRGVSGGIGIVLFFMTLQSLPLASANILQNTSPIFTSILGIFMLDQRVSVYRWLFFAISFLGVGLTHTAGFNSLDFSFYSLAVGLVSAFMMGLSNNFTSKIGDVEHPLVIFNYSTLVVLLISGTFLLFNNFVELQPKDWLILGGMGVFSCMAHYLAIRAYQLSPVAQVSAISYLGIPYALLIDLFVFGERFHWTSLLGMCLVMLGVFLSLKHK